jgi:uncharacterized protein (TIGR02453 family)
MVEPETFSFLTNLAKNNRKTWVDSNRSAFDDARRNFIGIATTLHDYAERFDPDVADTKSKPKQSYSKLYQDPRDRVGRAMYRIDVDVFANAGHAEEDFGYYLHIEPGNCYAGAGLFNPSKMALARMRQRLVDEPEGMTELLADTDFAAMFSDGVFTRQALSTPPDGYASPKTVAPYMKMVGLGCRKDLADAELLDDDVINALVEIFRAARALVTYFE